MDLESVLKQVKASGMFQYPMTYGDGVLAYQSCGYDMENFGDNYCSRGYEMLYGRMTEDMQNVCIDIAAKAFANYDYFSIYVTNDKKRLRSLKSMLGCLV